LRKHKIRNAKFEISTKAENQKVSNDRFGRFFFRLLVCFDFRISDFEFWNTTMVRVVLPYHLRNLAQVSSEVQLDVPAPVTAGAILDALEARYPMLCGAIRDHGTLKRRAFLRFFVCQEDVSHDSPDAPLPEAVALGKEPFYIIGAIAGG
jgi:hypothetical protein